MNAREAGKLLAILSTIDNREVDATRAQGWAWALPDVPYPRVLEAAHRAVQAGATYVDVHAIQRELRAMQPQLERDIRSAKARGIISADWDPKTPLTAVLEQQLRAAQTTEWEQSNDAPEDLVAPGPTAQLGVVLRAPGQGA